MDREEFLRSCLNAAANLYGVFSYDDFRKLYTGYASAHDEDIAREVTDKEIEEIAGKIPGDMDFFDVWFTTCTVNDRKYIVAKYGFCDDDDDDDPEVNIESVEKQLSSCIVEDFKVLPEKNFLLYDEAMGFEENAATRKVSKFIRDSFYMKQMEADLAVWDIQGFIRYRPMVEAALSACYKRVELEVEERDTFDELVKLLIPLVANTRTWNYRGYTGNELKKLKVDLGDTMGDVEKMWECFQNGEEDYDWDDDDEENIADDDSGKSSVSDIDINLDDIPHSTYPTEPINFNFVNDSKKRDKALYEYDKVRELTQEFVRSVIIPELKPKEREAAYARLGFSKQDALSNLSWNQDCIAGDFASMMDDQFGEPPIKRVLKKTDTLKGKEKRAAEFYANYKYTWLVVLAAKSGVGLKCRNLMTGEELFLMEKSMSTSPNIKGMTICAGIAPMGNVYLALGTIHPAKFENPEAILNLVLAHLGLPTAKPISLSFADQAKLATETIRRINKAGRLGMLGYGNL